MDFRFIAAGILAGAIGFVGGSTVFADTRRPADPTIASLAVERQAVDAAAAELPPAAKLPALPKPAAEPVIPPPKIRRVVIVRRVRTTTTAEKKTSAAPRRKHEDEHEGGGDD